MATKKGQAAMEYLMTYGWAILIVIVVVAALYAMGVFTPTSSTTACSPCFNYFSFIDYAGGTMVLRNGPSEIYILSATGATAPVATHYLAGQDITFTGISTSGNVDIAIIYNQTSGLNHTASATIHN